ncbi:MAG: hypothetical protein AMXMBFR6_23990 [Betaproteobacteria bacterium]|nr:SCO family protein [Rhodocyclaceae bacterium]
MQSDRLRRGSWRRLARWDLLCLAATASAMAAAPAVAPSAGRMPTYTAEAADEPPPAPTLDRDAALRASQAAIGRTITGYALLDRQGQPLRLAQYRGKPLLVSFVYTGCFQACPTGTRTLQESLRVLNKTFGADRFNVISIGFNQPADSPQAMRAFAAQHRIDAPNWDVLSPPPASAEALTRAFGFSYLATPAGFDHVVGVTVVDADGRIYAQAYGERMTPDQLGEPLRQLLRGAPMPQRLDIATLVERVRLVCTIYDPETGSYRYNYGLIFEIAGGVTFMLAMLVFFGLEARSRRRSRLAPDKAIPPAAGLSH